MNMVAIVIIGLILVAAYALTRKRKDQKPDAPPSGPWVPPVVADNPPTTIKPEPVGKPPEPVLLDRNRKSPGDPGYDPRAVRPDPEFSPVEPQGTFYGEGAFDPNGRYIDTQGRLHNP